MPHSHLGQMVLDRAAIDPDATAIRYRKGDAYVDLTWRALVPRLEHIAAGLVTAIPALEHAAAITIIGNTSADWIVCDLAAQTIGLRTVPVYASLLPEEVGYFHVDTAAVIAVCENAEQVAKVRAMRSGGPSSTSGGRRSGARTWPPTPTPPAPPARRRR